ncbi:MAG: clostripain-related cysteine peptidase [Fimbriimonadales bacterium]|nr:clostripain-related cysteine peptidase [Fimbriimonadales bacterium]
MTKRTLRCLLGLLTLAILLPLVSGCGGGRASVPPGGRGSLKWTVMVFMNAANDLDDYSELNINQMEQIQTNPNVRVVVQWKRAARFAPAGSWTGTRRYLIQYDTDAQRINARLLQDLGEGVDMGNANTLREFIQWARASYPADRYALVIWNHGSGWRSRAALHGRAVSFDDELGTSIKIWELPTAVRPTSADPVMDVLLFDASLMQMLEVAYECRNIARYIVGSEESPPGEGYPYHEILKPLMDNSDIAPVQWVSAIPNIFVNWYHANFPSYRNITQSAVDASRLDAVANALDGLAGSLLEKRTLYAVSLARARQDAQNYSTYPEYRDLWRAAELIKQYTGDAELSQRVNALHIAMQQAIVANNRDTRAGSRVFHSYGLSIYYPDSGSYLGRYSNTALARATRWDEWLQVAP